MTTAQEIYENKSREANYLLGDYPNSLPTCIRLSIWTPSLPKRNETKGKWIHRLAVANQDKALARAEKLGLLGMKAKREALRARREARLKAASAKYGGNICVQCNIRYDQSECPLCGKDEITAKLDEWHKDMPQGEEEEPWFTGECGRDSYKADFCTHCEVEGKSCRLKAVVDAIRDGTLEVIDQGQFGQVADAEKEVIGCSSESVVDAVERATVCMECGLDFIICTCQPVPPKAELTPPVPQEAPPVVMEEEDPAPAPWAKFSNVCADRKEEDGTRCHEYPAYTGSGFANGVALCNKHWKTRTQLPWPGDLPPAEPAPVVEEETVEEVEVGQVKIPYTGKPCPFTYKASYGGYICGCKDTYLNKEEQPACCMHWDFIKDGTWPGGCDSAWNLPAGQGSCGKTPYKIFKVPDGSGGVINRGRPYCEEHWKYILANEPFVCAYFEPRKPLERKNAFIEGDDTGHLDSVAPFAQSSGGTIVLPPPAPGPSRRLHAFCADCKRIYDIRIHACVNCGETTAVGRKEDIARAFGKSLSQMAWLAGSVKRFCEGCRVTKTMRRYDEEGKEEKLCYVCRQHPKPNKFAFIV